jgi:hypothetical protein
MTEVQKAPYEKVAKERKEEYLKQMEVYKQKKTEVCHSSAQHSVIKILVYQN